jgi:hypothetical protein
VRAGTVFPAAETGEVLSGEDRVLLQLLYDVIAGEQPETLGHEGFYAELAHARTLEHVLCHTVAGERPVRVNEDSVRGLPVGREL